MKSPDLETNQGTSQTMKSADLETDHYTSMKIKRKIDTRYDDEILAKTRCMESVKKAACSSDSTEDHIIQGDRHTKPIIQLSGVESHSTEVTSSHLPSGSLSSPLFSPRDVGERTDVESVSRVNAGRLSTMVQPGQFGGMDNQESFLQRGIEPGDSLVRLFKQRYPPTHRDLPLGRSAFREVCKGKTSTPFSPQLLPLRPRLLNEQLYGPTGVRPKVGKPFAGLSEIDVRTNSEGKTGINTINKSNMPNQTQPISQPLQESRTRHLTLAQLSANGTSQTWPHALRLGPYRSLRHSLLESRVDNQHLNSVKTTPLMSFGRFHGNATDNRSNQHMSAPNNIQPYMAVPGLMLAATSPPLWQPPSIGMLTMPSENWCARCKTSFRMTSDLVYHMRTYHKRENLTTGGASRVDAVAVSSADSVTRKDDKQEGDKSSDEKTLRCKVCRETFRERHHLTRHMTSHVR